MGADSEAVKLLSLQWVRVGSDGLLVTGANRQPLSDHSARALVDRHWNAIANFCASQGFSGAVLFSEARNYEVLASDAQPQPEQIPQPTSAQASDMVFSRARHFGLNADDLKILERMRSSEKTMSICDLNSDDQEWVNIPLTQMLQMTSDQACEQNMKDYWEEDALAYVKRILRQQTSFDHSYEAMLPYARANFSSTFEVIEFGHPKRLKRLVTIHSYEPVQQAMRV